MTNRLEAARHRLFAWFWRLASGPVNRTLAAQKRRLFVDLPQHLVEIGPGIGANFEYYPPGTSVLGFEPNPGMHDGLRAAARRHDIDLEIAGYDLREAQIKDESIDAVVSTLTLCSVDDAAGLVAEIKRILRPGGKLLLLEHVAAAEGTAAWRIGKIVRRPWAAIGDGCDMLAPTGRIVEQAGFSTLDTHSEPFGPGFVPSRIHYWGAAVK